MPVGYVACGSTHTLACSRDGNTVWSFGSGDNGKLGHGNTLRLYKPQKIDGLRHYKIKKVAAGIHFSVALTCTGEVCILLLLVFVFLSARAAALRFRRGYALCARWADAHTYTL